MDHSIIYDIIPGFVEATTRYDIIPGFVIRIRGHGVQATNATNIQHRSFPAGRSPPLREAARGREADTRPPHGGAHDNRPRRNSQRRTRARGGEPSGPSSNAGQRRLTQLSFQRGGHTQTHRGTHSRPMHHLAQHMVPAPKNTRPARYDHDAA